MDVLGDNSTTWLEFVAYMKEYNKTYASTAQEYYRYTCFQYNLAHIAIQNAAHNESSGMSDPVFGVNVFGNQLPIEFSRTYKTYKAGPAKFKVPIDNPTAAPTNAPLPPNTTVDTFLNDTLGQFSAALDSGGNSTGGAGRRLLAFSPVGQLPTTVDWRARGAVTAVQDQGQCGSCYAFSATEQYESAYFIAHGVLPSVSAQQIASCDTNNYGCNGGDPTVAYNYMMRAGVQSMSSCPYTNGAGGSINACQYSPGAASYKMSGWRYASQPCTNQNPNCNAPVSEAVLAAQVAAWGPASICVTANVWQCYSGGILAANCESGYATMDHCIQLVGFSVSNPAGYQYWIIRNQWGRGWGDNGYIYVLMGSNLCGIANEASFITVV